MQSRGVGSGAKQVTAAAKTRHTSSYAYCAVNHRDPEAQTHVEKGRHEAPSSSRRVAQRETNLRPWHALRETMLGAGKARQIGITALSCHRD